MADETESVRAGLAGSADPAALHMAMGAASDEARDYLRRQAVLADKQVRLADLQIDNLQKQDEFELSHLRFRRFSDYARFALEIAGFLVVLLIVCGLGTMVWNASQDHDLVVDAFSVPPDVAQSGMTGSVLAGRVLDRFGHMQADTNGTTQGAASYRADKADTVRVEIPDTGVSLGELNRYLRAWLGSETHVAGDLVHTAGGFALTVRYGAAPGSTVEGNTGEFDTLVEKSAEHVFAAALPYRYVEYLVHLRRFDDAAVIVPGLAATGPAHDRALANSAWAKLYFFQGDMPHALEKGREAVRLDPNNPITRAWLAVAESNLGHEEAARANCDAVVKLWQGSDAPDLGGQTAVRYPLLFTAYRDEETGDYAEADRAWIALGDIRPLRGNDQASATSDFASAHDLVAARRYAAAVPAKDELGRPSISVAAALMVIALERGNWDVAVKQGRAIEAILNAESDQQWQRDTFRPALAYSLARGGDLGDAKALIAKTLFDCDECVRERGRIAAIAGNWPEAARDFALVAGRSPYEPTAETDWGQVLMEKGDLDAAIAQFKVANEKGPHFADPLEMWGEALIRQNRSDLALAKFEDANKYAPTWGRLHLKWGEALLWTGDKVGAQKQFAISMNLELTSAEQGEVARVRKAHG